MEDLIDYDDEDSQYQPYDFPTMEDDTGQRCDVEQDTGQRSNVEEDEIQEIQNLAKTVNESLLYEPASRNLYRQALRSASMNDILSSHKAQVVDVFLGKFKNHKLLPKIISSVLDHFKKIDSFRNEILSSSIDIVSDKFETIVLKKEHIEQDPYAELFLETICKDNGCNKKKFCKIISDLHVKRKEHQDRSNNVEDFDDDQFNMVSFDDVAYNSSNHDNNNYEEMWSFRSLFLHQYFFALLQTYPKYDPNYKFKVGCPLSMNFDNESNNYRLKSPKRFFPTISSELAGFQCSGKCDHICSCPCNTDKSDFKTLLFDLSFEDFKSYWKANHEKLSSGHDSQTIEEHLLFGDPLEDPEHPNMKFMEGRVGTNTFNIMHHMIYHCVRLIFSYTLVRKDHPGKLENLISGGIVFDDIKKVLKWKNFMYELPTKSMLKEFSSPSAFSDHIEEKKSQEDVLSVIKTEYYTGEFSESFFDEYKTQLDLRASTADDVVDTNWLSLSNLKKGKDSGNVPATIVAITTDSSKLTKNMPLGVSRRLQQEGVLVGRSVDLSSNKTQNKSAKPPSSSTISSKSTTNPSSRSSPQVSSRQESKQTDNIAAYSAYKGRTRNKDSRSFAHYGPSASRYYRYHNSQYPNNHTSFHRSWNGGFDRYNSRGNRNHHYHVPSMPPNSRNHSHHSAYSSQSRNRDDDHSFRHQEDEYSSRYWDRNAWRDSSPRKEDSHRRRDRGYSYRDRDYHYHYSSLKQNDASQGSKSEETDHFEGRKTSKENVREQNDISQRSKSENTNHSERQRTTKRNAREQSPIEQSEYPYSQTSSVRRDSFSSSISTSVSSSSKRQKIHKVSKPESITQLKKPSTGSDKSDKAACGSDQVDQVIDVLDIKDNKKILTYLDGTQCLWDLEKSETILLPDTINSFNTKNAPNKSIVRHPDTRKKKKKKHKNQGSSSETSYPDVMSVENQAAQMEALVDRYPKEKYPKEDRTNLLDDALGDNLNKYSPRRSREIFLRAVNCGILQAMNEVDTRDVVLKEITHQDKPKLHFGVVRRAIGLNRNNVFLVKICFGAVEKIKKYDGYEAVTTQWNAVVTLEEIRHIIKCCTMSPANSADSFVEIKNAPKPSQDLVTTVYRPQFVIDIPPNNLGANHLYLRCFTHSSTDIMDDVNHNDKENERLFTSSKNIEHTNLLESVHHSVVDSIYYAISNKNVCLGSHNSTKDSQEDGVTKSHLCVVCGTHIRTNSSFGSINDTVGKHYPKNPLSQNICLDFIHICTKCVCDSVQAFKYFNRNSHLMHCLNATVLYSKATWGKRQEYELASCWQKYFPTASKELRNDPAFLEIIESTVSFRTYDVRHSSLISKVGKRSMMSDLKKSIEGASFFDSHDFSNFTKNAVCMPQDVDFGIVLLPEDDFIFVCNSNFRIIDCIHISLCEALAIKRLKCHGRSGAAGGIVSTDTNSHSMTKNTKRDENVFVPSKKGVGISCVYKNHMNQIKSFSGVYNDVYMNRIGIKEKTHNVHQNISYARISLAEMKTRTISLILASELGLLTQTEIIDSFKFLSCNNLKPSQRTEHCPLKLHRKSRLDIFTNFERLLLHQACTTGEMRNHQALHAHVDGNKSHFLESLALFGRINVEDVYKEAKLSDVVQNMTGGYLYLPLEGIVLSMTCCTMSVHCKLKKTIHIPDLSRNTHNWSKVHGPSGSWVVDTSNHKKEKKRKWFEKNVSSLFN